MSTAAKTPHEKSPPPELEGKGSHKAAKEFEQAEHGPKIPQQLRENKPVKEKKK